MGTQMNTMMAPEGKVKKKRRRRNSMMSKPMSPNRQELHRMVRETMEQGYGTHYGAYVASVRIQPVQSQSEGEGL